MTSQSLLTGRLALLLPMLLLPLPLAVVIVDACAPDGRTDYSLYGSLCALYVPLSELSSASAAAGDRAPLLTFAGAQSLCRSRDGDLVSSDADLAAVWPTSSAMGATVWLGLTATADGLVAGRYRWLSGGRPFGLNRSIYWERSGALTPVAVAPTPTAAEASGCVAMYTLSGLRVLQDYGNCSAHQPAIDGLLCRYDGCSARARARTAGRQARILVGDPPGVVNKSAAAAAAATGAVQLLANGRPVSLIECLARCSAQPLCRIAHHLTSTGACYVGFYDLLPRPFLAVDWTSAVFE